ncbi:MAG TPA: DNA repair protein [Moraxellaceae bacterium]|nr:DNA repair protein [Moraxellaceae bacterium]
MKYQTSTHSSTGLGLLETSNGMYQITAPVTLDELLSIASGLLEEQFKRSSYLNSPTTTRSFLQTRLCTRDREVFSCVFLDSQHGVLAYEELFVGTIDSASVYPREVIKRALALNAAALICSHNHPSGVPEPSSADRQITDQLSKALDLVGVRLLDHIVIGGTKSVSFAERGWL